MSRPLSGLSSLQIKIIQEIQQGSTYEAASCAAGYKYPSDLKKPAKRAMCKLKKATLNEQIRHAIRQKYPELILMGAGTNTRLEPFTEVNHKFAEIDEGFRNFTESMLLQGWDLKYGVMVKK